MLVEFTVENYRSFREKTCLSMVATSDDTLPENVVKDAFGSGLDILKSVVVYGANASGKSNLIKAIRTMDRIVLLSAKEGIAALVNAFDPFLLVEKSKEEPTSFSISFINTDGRYTYGFSYNKDMVIEEFLYLFPFETNRKNVIFERTCEANKSSCDWKFGSLWKGPKTSLVESTRPDALLVSVGWMLNNETTNVVTKWFSDTLRDLSHRPHHEGEMAYTNRLMQNSGEFPLAALEFLKNADTGIDGLSVKKATPEEYDSHFSSFPDEIADAIKAASGRTGLKDVYGVKVSTTHKFRDEAGDLSEVNFDMEEHESDGTQKIYAMSGPWLMALTYGFVLTADEFDSRLHENISIWIIETLHKETINVGNAQAIITTHNTTLLDSELFRRDQVWITEKDSSGASRLYALTDFKGIRKGEQLRKGYLSGRYGGVPITGGH